MLRKFFHLYPNQYESGEEICVGDTVYIPNLKKAGQVVFHSFTGEVMTGFNPTRFEGMESGFIISIADQLYRFSSGSGVVYKKRAEPIKSILPNNYFPENVIASLSFGEALKKFFIRLVVGFLVLTVLLAIFILNAIPYGGGPKEPVYAFALVAVATPVWALWPMSCYAARRLMKNN